LCRRILLLPFLILFPSIAKSKAGFNSREEGDFDGVQTVLWIVWVGGDGEVGSDGIGTVMLFCVGGRILPAFGAEHFLWYEVGEGWHFTFNFELELDGIDLAGVWHLGE
jgi:hypothetical protein